MKTATLASIALAISVSAANAQTIGVSMSDLDKFRTALLNGVVSHGQTISGLKLVTENAKGDNELQKQQVQKLIADKVDAIILAVSDGDLGPQMTKMAADAGIPLVYINNIPSNLLDLPDNQVVVASNEKESGTLETKQVCTLLKGKGRVVVLMGEPFHAAARARTQDISDVIATPECKGLEIVERQAAYWSRDYADQQMQEWLAAGVKFDAVIANNDEMALGAIRAMKKNNIPMKDVVVAGVDATDDALAAMVAGDLDVTILQSAVGQGATAVEAAAKLIRKEKVPRENNVPFELVTPENIATYLPKSQ
ncbi:ribose transport system substrate-binding protein/inositol transport system substrate-binding protein [Rhizobium leguminosarum]|uniref:Ribose transport system substrate-binding protein/inositol transport system substrate-binding protein n=1 Tax=Rhizobium leguminosarum TaxID=384 RepID=A0AAE2SY26_RHILE|nr:MULTISPECIES: substrate-binding domain-containing protein [Rhizobium]MBB4292542.1 ribose transport system substrate-binding protein/inositol transport system substrate-binding protein [Rhizobium leguminosarum]MBB4298781.1 ribose transport system substrate-binding protein/inositol transport system substrate-binding protein [Rhizobium leguminosarum]MBB4310246.1 ribose transport system substrate-binding protein/inositol transport system substrate-binding protein [Rhizobium leguminosarum]MBB4434